MAAARLSELLFEPFTVVAPNGARVELTAGATSPERSEVFDFELFIVVARSGAGVGVALGRVRTFAREEFKAIESAFGFGVG